MSEGRNSPSAKRPRFSVSEESLECKICYEVYTHPVVLPCQHTFCISCVARASRRTSEGGAIECPMCRSKAEFPNGDISNLPTNRFIIDIMEQNGMENCFLEKEELDKLLDEISQEPGNSSDDSESEYYAPQGPDGDGPQWPEWMMWRPLEESWPDYLERTARTLRTEALMEENDQEAAEEQLSSSEEEPEDFIAPSDEEPEVELVSSEEEPEEELSSSEEEPEEDDDGEGEFNVRGNDVLERRRVTRHRERQMSLRESARRAADIRSRISITQSMTLGDLRELERCDRASAGNRRVVHNHGTSSNTIMLGDGDLDSE